MYVHKLVHFFWYWNKLICILTHVNQQENPKQCICISSFIWERAPPIGNLNKDDSIINFSFFRNGGTTQLKAKFFQVKEGVPAWKTLMQTKPPKQAFAPRRLLSIIENQIYHISNMYVSKIKKVLLLVQKYAGKLFPPQNEISSFCFVISSEGNTKHINHENVWWSLWLLQFIHIWLFIIYAHSSFFGLRIRFWGNFCFFGPKFFPTSVLILHRPGVVWSVAGLNCRYPVQCVKQCLSWFSSRRPYGENGFPHDKGEVSQHFSSSPKSRGVQKHPKTQKMIHFVYSTFVFTGGVSQFMGRWWGVGQLLITDERPWA